MITSVSSRKYGMNVHKALFNFQKQKSELLRIFKKVRFFLFSQLSFKKTLFSNFTQKKRKFYLIFIYRGFEKLEEKF